jgi:hypothetical protein
MGDRGLVHHMTSTYTGRHSMENTDIIHTQASYKFICFLALYYYKYHNALAQFVHYQHSGTLLPGEGSGGCDLFIVNVRCLVRQTGQEVPESLNPIY